MAAITIEGIYSYFYITDNKICLKALLKTT